MMKTNFTLLALGLLLTGCMGCTSAQKEIDAQGTTDDLIEESVGTSPDSDPVATTSEPVMAPDTTSSMTAPIAPSDLSLGSGSSGRGH